MDRLLSLSEALEHERLSLDRQGQIGYFAECLLGGLHGIGVHDLLADFTPASSTARALAEFFSTGAQGEAQRFMRATSLKEPDYSENFGADPPDASLHPLLKLAGLG
ncbi:MAG TPA: hypothetical protein VIX12_04885, partial [Candidatus Binataceae bacterium]